MPIEIPYVSNSEPGSFIIMAVHGTVEQNMTSYSPIHNRRVGVHVDLSSLVASGEGGTVTVRFKHKVDDVNYVPVDIASFIVGVDELHPELDAWGSSEDDAMLITIQLASAVTADRTVYYKIMEG